MNTPWTRLIAPLFTSMVLMACTVNVNQPNVGSGNKVSAKVNTEVGVNADVGRVDAEQVVTEEVAAEDGVEEATLNGEQAVVQEAVEKEVKPEKPPYALRIGGMSLSGEERAIMVEMGLINPIPKDGGIEYDKLSLLSEGDLIEIRSRLFTRDEILEKLEKVSPSTPTPQPTSTPSGN